MEGQVCSQDIGGTIKEVRQVYRSPAKTEKGKEYDIDDARRKETSDVELHVAMEQLFREGPAPITPGNSIPQSSSSSGPNLPLVLYQPLGEIFVKLRELSKLNSVQSTTVIHTSSSASNIISQLRVRGFFLVTPTQGSMAGSFSRYPEFSGKGNDDVEQHWYLCEAIWRARHTPEVGKLIEFQNTLRERSLRWLLKWYEAHHNPTIDDVKRDFFKEFKLPQTDQQGLSEMWEIKQREGETTWDQMRRFKDAVGKLNYPIDPNHQRDWFIKWYEAHHN